MLIPVLVTLAIVSVAPSQATPLTCNMSVISGDDDGSFQMNLPFSLQLGNTEYNQIYYSTNGFMSFGQPDGTYWTYPSTPSITVAGRDWVSWGDGAYTSYGYNESSFCIEWSVRPFPMSSGDLTQIRLVANKFPNGAWHGEITTLGWIPDNIRRGIVWEQGGTPLPIAAAFDVNGGVPIEVSPAPAPTSLTDPPAIPTQCWDGSTVYSPSVCPSEPSFTCWDGTTTHYASECLSEPVVICWDNTQVHYQSECSSTPPDITCWNGEVVPWNGSCQQVPPPIECWDGSSVNWDAQCPEQPPVDPTPSPNLSDSPVVEPTQTPVPNIPEPTPTPTESPVLLPLPEPSISQSPIPTPSPSETIPVVHVVIPSPNPEPVVSSPSPEVPVPLESPSPGPVPADIPSINDSTEERVNYVLENLQPGEAVSADMISELGIDYEDLPPDTPVELPNGVILTAEVADALQMFENPDELLATVFTDPGKALKALANIGADMTPQERDKSKKVIIAAVIAAQLMNGLSVANNIGRKL